MAMMVGYWHKDGLDIYRYVDKKPVKQASGSLDGLKPIRGGLGKKVLIVSRELLLHAGKRYPPAPLKKLTKAVALEIGDIFPISKPAFHCRVHESSTAYTTLDIWAWESESYGRLREVFPFNYIVPEDLAYSSDVPEVKVFQYRGMTNILAHSGPRFLGGASCTDGGIDEKSMERFLSGLGRDRSDIKQIKIYGSVPFQFKTPEISEISRVAQGDYPPCMDFLAGLNFDEFKVKRDIGLSLKIDLLLRILIYLVLGYGLMVYLTVKNYDQATGEITQKVRAIDAKISHGDADKKVEDYSEIIKTVNEKLSTRYSPLKVMDTIAKVLPTGGSITRMVLNENKLEVSVSSKDPLSVVKALGGAEGIKTARLKGAPGKDASTGSYNFNVTVELSR
ncbi:MAG: PilN domain-containing protein [Deltaproteobacteria bacterium]